MSRILDWTDRTTAVLFGDGAGAFVLEATPGGTSNDSDLLDHLLACDGNKSELLSVDGGPSLNQSVGHLRMNGREVFRHAVSNMSHTILTVLERNSLTIEDIDWFVPHQANFRIIKAVAARVGLPIEKTVVTVGQHANTSAASIPLAMHEAVQDGRIQRGHLIMTEAMGGGFTWGGNLIRW
jgi:3-oxoacyl-[acyl-carrier-protein] synthase-3